MIALRALSAVGAVAVGTAAVGALATGCKGDRTPAPAASAASASAKSLPPINESSWLVELPVEGFEAASVAVPLGATQPRPVVIALHGGADRPEWACGTWVGIARSHPFVLCPRGVKVSDAPRYGWESSDQTAKELRASLKALKARYGAHVAPGPVILGAFSAGTRPAVDILRSEPSFFSRVVLVAPEANLWSAGLAGIFARAGGRNLMFVCSDASCRSDAERYFVFSRGVGSQAKLLDLPEMGRVLDGRVAAAISEHFDWLVEGDDRYPGATKPASAPTRSSVASARTAPAPSAAPPAPSGQARD